MPWVFGSLVFLPLLEGNMRLTLPARYHPQAVCLLEEVVKSKELAETGRHAPPRGS